MIDPAPTLLGASTVARELDVEISVAARSDAKVLITGESGSGKEVTARLVHERSARRGGPMVAINCAGVPDGLLESELFGHVRGSFTDAYRDKAGILEAGHGGTVFLDEIGEMSLRMQALLLRFLETGEIQRVGADRASARLDVRIICATNRDLSARIASGDFREDLFYRLNVIRIDVPPLRERRDDIAGLLEHFLRHYASRHRVALPQLDQGARRLLLEYHWPGNVRELKNVVERLVVRAQRGRIDLDDLPSEVRRRAVVLPRATSDPGQPAAPPQEVLADLVALELFERMTEHGRTFWAELYEPFMSRDLTRDVLRRVVRLGLQRANGRYSALTDLFHMHRDDYKRFLNFLRKHDCLVPFHEFRGTRPPDSPGVPTDPDGTRAQVA